MENSRLLEIRRKRLSIYFALFILFSIWLVEVLFLAATYYNNNIKLEDKLKIRVKWVENVLINKEEYLEKIKNNDYAMKSLLEKALDWVTITQWNNRIIWTINQEYFNKLNSFYDSKNKKYYVSTFWQNWEYKIIISETNQYSYYNLLIELLYFLLFTLPFSLLFYALWYFFVGKNFRPIREVIASLEDFSANINHELKTPIAEVISTLSLTKELWKNYEKAIDTSLNSAHKIAKILDSMLWIINLVDSSFKKEKVDLVLELNRIIEDNEKKIAEKQIKIKKNYWKKSFTLNINKEHFNICVGNILKNAIKYSNEKWIIEISFEGWIIEVKDNGIGIEEKNLANIFSRYFRENYLKEEWFWLWLSLVKKITDINSWKIEIESKKDQWTKVIINFNK